MTRQEDTCPRCGANWNPTDGPAERAASDPRRRARTSSSRAPTPNSHNSPRQRTRDDPVRDRLVITPGQRRRSAQRAGQVVCLKDLHHFLSFLQIRPPTRVSAKTRMDNRHMGQKRGEKRWPPMGRSDGHQLGTSGGRQWGDSHGHRQRRQASPQRETCHRGGRSAELRTNLPCAASEARCDRGVGP
jgi:hypothetical protein